MSSGRSIKIVLFAGTAFVGLMAAILPAEAGSRFGGAMGGGGAAGRPFSAWSSRLWVWRRSWQSRSSWRAGRSMGAWPSRLWVWRRSWQSRSSWRAGRSRRAGSPWGPSHPGSEFRRSTDAGVAGAVPSPIRRQCQIARMSFSSSGVLIPTASGRGAFATG
jgi:hypothetical protein